jgi:hypothetical protein
MNRKAQKMGVVRKRKPDVNLAQSVTYWFLEFDGKV